MDTIFAWFMLGFVMGFGIGSIVVLSILKPYKDVNIKDHKNE